MIPQWQKQPGQELRKSIWEILCQRFKGIIWEVKGEWSWGLMLQAKRRGTEFDQASAKPIVYNKIRL